MPQRSRKLLSVAMVAVFAGSFVLGAGTAQAATCSVPSTYLTIQSAVDDPNCTVINVAAGAYPGNVTIPRAVTLRGARAGNSISGRTFPSVAESTVAGLITIQAANVTIDGFSVTNPGQSTGILIKTAGNAALIVNNIIDTVGGAAFADNTQAIYLEYGPDNVRVIGNRMSHIEGVATSNGGVYIGDSTSADPSLNIIVAGNTISNVHSVNRGAYAIHTNNGSSTAPSATGYTTVAIWGNTISDLLGGVWAHAIGLEGDTPGVIVRLNSISNVNAGTPNRVAVYFEDNPSFASGHVNQNNLDVTPAAYGIAVNPVPATSVALVDGTCNWWGDKGGPGPIGPNPLGAKVGPNVDFDPWLTNRAPSRCGPAKPPKCQPGTAVNGSGDVSGTDERGKHQGHFDFDECDGDHEFSHRDSDRNVDFHSDNGAPGTTTVDAASPTATTTGQGWNNGAAVSYQLVVTDLGIGPGTDVYSLTLSDPSGVIYSITGTLTAGNLNVHP